MLTVVEGNPKAPFSLVTGLSCGGGHYYFPWIVPFYSRYIPYLIILSLKEGGIKYYFLSL